MEKELSFRERVCRYNKIKSKHKRTIRRVKRTGDGGMAFDKVELFIPGLVDELLAINAAARAKRDTSEVSI